MGVTDMGMPCLKYEEHCALGKEMCQCFQGSDRKPGLEVRVSGFQPKAGSVQSRSLFGIISENLQNLQIICLWASVIPSDVRKYLVEPKD